MPIPKPRKGETEDKFISRCMGNPTMTEEYEQEQRSAICYQSWRDKDKQRNNELTSIIANIDVSQVREEAWKGKQYLVAPVIMAKEGVMNELFYPASELSKFPAAWDGRPLTLFHPKNNDGDFISANDASVSESVHLGMVRSTKYDGVLRAEAWLDKDHAQTTRPELLDYYNGQKDQLEVSTGLFGDVLMVPGKHNEEDYKGIMTNIRPDHLALLPGGEGACSWSDGCGLRVNEIDIKFPIALMSMTDDEKRRKLQTCIDAMDSPQYVHYIEAVVSDTKEVIYARTGRNGPPLTGGDKMYRQKYAVDDKGDVSLEGSPEEVRKQVSYIKAQQRKEGGRGTMDKEQRIEALINDPRTKWEAGCKDFLSGLNEDQLERLTPPDNVVIKEEAPVVNQEQSPNPPLSAVEWISAQESMPKEVRDTLNDAMALNAMQRAELIEDITKNPNNSFTIQELELESTPKLRALAKLAKQPEKKEDPSVNQGFFGLQGGTLMKGNDDKGPEPLIMESLTERFKANLKR